ncbi:MULTISPECIES: hypothetical protein [Brucella]|nr:hypothetical protein [Brucella intermedia]
MADYLHRHPEFPDLLRIVGEKMGFLPALVEKITGSCIASSA